MQPIDYSRWDHIECSSSSSFDDKYDSDNSNNIDECESNRIINKENTRDKNHSHVTKLEYPSTVVIGPDGVHMERMPQKALATPFGQTHTDLKKEKLNESLHNNIDSKLTTMEECANDNNHQINDNANNAICESSEAEDDILVHSLTKNGGREGESHLWAQTADTVTVSFIVPMQTKSKDIYKFAISDNYELETCQTESIISFELQSRELATNNVISKVYQYTFRYPVKLDDDLLCGCWQLQTIPSQQLRLLVVQVFKREVGVGLTLWWDKCFKEDSQSSIDPCEIEERKHRGNTNPNAFHENWVKAHAEFKKRMQERKSSQVEIEEYEEEEQEEEEE